MRLIDADGLAGDWLQNGENERIYDTNDFLDSIDRQPTVDAVPVTHGLWITKGAYLSCSACGFRDNHKMVFRRCPYCGAKMD